MLLNLIAAFAGGGLVLLLMPAVGDTVALPAQAMSGVLALLAAVCLLKVWVLNGMAMNLINKAKMLTLGIAHLVLSRDKGWSKSKLSDTANVVAEGKTVTLYFIRHGESEWNSVFNVGIPPGLNAHKLKIIPRLIVALIRELVMAITRDSIFFDSPLNADGIEQAVRLADTIAQSRSKADAPLQSATAKSSVVVVSNLRRAIETVFLCLRGRLSASGERVVMHSSLQEISRNIDTLALAQKGSTPAMPALAATLGGALDANACLECTHNSGNKPLLGNGLTRMEAFCDWCFNRKEDTVIVGGHSLWFRSFFQTFLPKECTKELAKLAKTNKVQNCGIVSLKLSRGKLAAAAGKTWYRIEQDSIRAVQGGFEEDKKKK